MSQRLNDKLCIFDYHGTLIWALDIHDVTYSRTVEEIYGVKGSIRDVYFSASTVQDITIAVAKNKGVSNEIAESKRHLILPIYEKHFQDELKHGKIRILSGIPELLYSLQKNNIPIGLYTGDSFISTDAILRKVG